MVTPGSMWTGGAMRSRYGGCAAGSSRRRRMPPRWLAWAACAGTCMRGPEGAPVQSNAPGLPGAGWLAHLDADSYPPAASLRPAAGWPDRAVVAAGLARVAAVIDRIAADVDELARARRVQDLDTAAVLPDPRAERRRRLAEPDLEFRAFCTRRRLPASSTPQLERAWDAWQAERYQRGEISQRPGYTDNPFRPR